MGRLDGSAQDIGNDFFRYLVENSGQCMGMVSLTGRIAYVNPSMARLLGVNNQTDLYLSSVFSLYDAATVDRLRSEIMPVVLKYGQWTGEIDIINRLGQKFACIQNLFIIKNGSGEPLCFATTCTDISAHRRLETELSCDRDQLEALAAQRTRELEASNDSLRERIAEHQRAEQELSRLAAILNSTSDLVSTAFPEGPLLYLNAAGRQMLGVPLNQDLVGFDMRQMHPAWAWQIVHDEGLPAAASAGLWQGETAIRNGSGQEIPVSQVIMAHHNAEGRLDFFSTIMRDISERQQAEHDLQTWKQRYDFLVEASGQIVYDYEVASGRITWGSSLEKVLGYALEEMAGGFPQWQALLHPDDSPTTLALLTEAEKACSFWDTRYRIRHRDGHYVWIRDRGYFLAGPNGLAERQLGLMEDISSLKQTEDALQESEHNFTKAFHHSSSLIIITSLKEGRFIEVNERFLNTLGYIREEVIGHSVTDLDYWVEPEQRRAAVRELQETGKLEDFEYRFRDKQGGIHWALSSAAVIELRGERYVLAHIIDITERKRAQQALAESDARLKEAQQLAQLGYWSWDVKTGQVEWSEEVFRIFGLEQASFTPEINSIMALSPWPEDHVRDQELIRRAMESHESGSYEQRFLRPDKSVGHYVSSFQGKYDEAGALVAIVGTLQDITERKHLENQLLQAQKMESIGRLAGGVAHDFNNLLTAISGNAELALMLADQSPELNAHLREIQQAASSAAELTRQLLTFSRKQIVELKVLDLNELLWATSKMLSRVIGEDISLRTIAQPGLNSVLADAGQLQQIIMNLAVNARDAMPDGGVLTIETANAVLDEAYCQQYGDILPGEYVLLSVCDTGCGMSSEVKEHIFEPFYTTKAIGHGTGLGLATVYGAVRQNRGIINVYSEPGQGSCFRIYLPKTTTPDSAQSQDAAVSPMPRGNETILLVEDDPRVRSFACMAIERLGYRVLSAARGEDALELARTYDGPIDLLLTDVVMPGLNGRQTADLIAAERPAIKVLFASGYTQDAIVQHGVLEQDINFIGKPYGAHTLAVKLREILDQA